MTLKRTITNGLLLLSPLVLLMAQNVKPGKVASAARTWGKPPAAEFDPQRVMLGWTGDPAHTQAITWRTSAPAATPQVQFAPANPNPDFINSAATSFGKASSLDTGGGRTVTTYRANIEGLKPDTRYHYRVGDGKNWGEWNTFHTSSDKPGSFRFLYVGDAQNDIKSRWSRVIRMAYTKAPDAAFILHAGDLVASGYQDDLWGEWYEAMGFIASNVPNLPAVGNHELEKPAGVPHSLALPAIWKQQFAYPANGPDVPENESYFIDYQGVRIISLNVNLIEDEKVVAANGPQAQQLVAWLEQVLKNNPNRWTVIVQHQGLFSMAEDRNYVKMRELMLPLIDKYHVDLVLQGHDHLYARSKKLFAGRVVAPEDPGTVYMISVSGPKMYEVDHHRFEPLMAKIIPHTQMFQTIDVAGDTLVLRAYSSEGQQLDGFQVKKSEGHSVYSELGSH